MYGKYKVTTSDDSQKKKPTQPKPTHQPPQGKFTKASPGAPPTHQPSKLNDRNLNQQHVTSSLATSSSTSSSVEDAVVMATVKATLKKIDEQCAQEMQRRREEVASAAAGGAASEDVKTMGGWKTIRVFVSSTFADMHSEREILVKKVFPELREWCEERKFSLVDCDLRWGVPKDSTSRTTICTCLEEIDRCHEDNERLPFFVSILSERYGWIPCESEVPEDVKEKYDWIPQTSITHMEILHGAYRFSNPNAIFCLRNSSYVDDLPSDKVSRFVDEEDLNKQQLKILKKRLRSKFPEQVFEYDCRVDGVDMSTGREKVNIVGLESFARQILDFLKAAINRQYPDQHLASDLSPSQMEQNAHNVSMQVKSECFVGRSDELRSLLSYIRDGAERDPKWLKTVTEKQREKEEEVEERDEEETRKKVEKLTDRCESYGVAVNDSRILSVVGQSGIGKSSLLAQLAKTAAEEGLRVLYHSVGTTDKSTTSNGIIRRIINSLKEIDDHQQKKEQKEHKEQKKHKEHKEQKEQTEQDEKSEEEAEKEKREKVEEEEENLPLLLKDAIVNAATRDVQQLIIIDGLDECTDNDTTQFMPWLPPRFPRRLRCVVSCSVDHYPCIARLKSRDSLFLHLDLLSRDGASAVVEYYLQRFNKRLDAVQLSSLLSHSSSSLPLWLSIACEELRVFGDFATVSSKIKNFPDELNDLMKDVFKRLIREDETQALRKVLSWIHCSKSGLPEKAILNLLGNPAANEPAPMVTWATVRRHLKPFIRSTGETQWVRIRMAHISMNKAVKELLFSSEEEEGENVDGKINIVKCHSYLADFYQYHCSTEWMTLSELPHHLYHARLGQRMMDFYRTDERTARVTGYERSKALNGLRCQGFIHNHTANDASNQLFVCNMCSMRKGLLSPNSFPTTELCAICGNWTPFKQPTNVARLCMRHAMRSAPSTTNCYICSNIIFINNTPYASHKPLYLCNFCHITGSTILKCAHLDK